MDTAIHFLGQALSEHLKICVKTDARLAKKKTALYLKFCQKFLCDSELALIKVRGLPRGFDGRTVTAIRDVISSHRQHIANLKAARQILSGASELELVPVLKKIDLVVHRLEALLKAWLLSGFGGRAFEN